MITFNEYREYLEEAATSITMQRDLILVEKEELDYEIWLHPDYLHLYELGINVYQGFLCHVDFTDIEVPYFPESSVVIIYDSETGEQLSYEHTASLYGAILRYFRFYRMDDSEDSISRMGCDYVFDDGKFLREKVLKTNNPVTAERVKVTEKHS